MLHLASHHETHGLVFLSCRLLTKAVIFLLQDAAAQVTVALPQHEACPATPTATLQTVPLAIQHVVVVDEAVRVGLDPIQPSLRVTAGAEAVGIRMEAKFCKRVFVVETELVGAKIEVGQFSVGVSGAEAVAVGPYAANDHVRALGTEAVLVGAHVAEVTLGVHQT